MLGVPQSIGSSSPHTGLDSTEIVTIRQLHVQGLIQPRVSICYMWAILSSREIFGYYQTAPRHENLLEAVRVPSLLPGHGRTYKPDNSTAHYLHWSAGNSMGLSKHWCHLAFAFLESSCILGSWVPTCSWVSPPFAEKMPPL